MVPNHAWKWQRCVLRLRSRFEWTIPSGSTDITLPCVTSANTQLVVPYRAPSSTTVCCGVSSARAITQ
eukprot:36904-Prymnesium_polylepis.3